MTASDLESAEEAVAEYISGGNDLALQFIDCEASPASTEGVSYVQLPYVPVECSLVGDFASEDRGDFRAYPYSGPDFDDWLDWPQWAIVPSTGGESFGFQLDREALVAEVGCWQKTDRLPDELIPGVIVLGDGLALTEQGAFLDICP
jgi:hypothetical protein